MALKTFQRHVYLAVKLTILIAVLFPLVFGNDHCSGDGSKRDTCPEGEYCGGVSCHDCSLCSVSALLQGATLTKCLCMPNTYKVCRMPASGEQLIEHPSQLSFTNWTGYEGMDLTFLNESYDRSSIDCTVPTTTKEPTSLAVMTTTLTTTLIPEMPEQTSPSIQSTTMEAASPTSEYQDSLVCIIFIIVISVFLVIVVALVVWIFLLHHGKCMIPCLKKTGGANDTGNNERRAANMPVAGEGDDTELEPLGSGGPNQA